MFFGGIDIAKHNHEIYIIDEKGDTVINFSIENKQKGLKKLLNKLERLDINAKGAKEAFKQIRTIRY